MKKRLLLLTFALAVTSAMPVFAMPKLMADGTVFDAKYYRKNNPDVVAVLGSDENALFTHYTLFGKNEGRKPCEDGAVPVTLINPYDDEVIVENTTPTAPVLGKPTGTGEYVDADGDEWTMKRTWTASNGVVLKIRDKYSHWDFENNMAARNTYDAREVLIIDDLDLRPGTPDFDAIVEFEYGTGAHEGGTEKMKISAADLPLVATPATKLTYAPETDSWNAYKAQFDPLWSYQSTGHYESPAELYNYGSGIGLLTGVVSSYIWNLDYIGDCWKLTLRGYPTELQWNSVRNSLRLVSPDGEQLFAEFYKQAYEDNPTFPEYGMWVNIGGSQAMVEATDFYYCYFK